MKIKMMVVCLILAFGAAGASYASWNSESVIYSEITTGKMLLQNEGNQITGELRVDLNSEETDYVIPFSIENSSTVPVKLSETTFLMDGKRIDSAGEVKLTELYPGRIDGELELKLSSLNQYIAKAREEGAAEEEFAGVLTMELEFVQANSDRGWKKTVEMDIEVVKGFAAELEDKELPADAVPNEEQGIRREFNSRKNIVEKREDMNENTSVSGNGHREGKNVR